MRKIVTAILLLTALACTFKRTYSDNLRVPGNAPAADKLRLAQEVGEHLYSDRLKPELKSRYGYTDEQLEGLFVRWNTTTVTSLVGKSAPSEPIVTLTVGIQTKGDLPRVEEAVKYCAAEAKKELDRRVGG